jgi:multidrug efflux pump
MHARWVFVATLAALFALTLGPARSQTTLREATIAVEAKLDGVPAEEIARQLAPAVENRVGAVEGLQFMVSLSRAGRVQVLLKFKPGVSAAAATKMVRAQLARLGGELPRGAAEPSLAAIAPEAQAVAYLAFWSDRHSALDITRAVQPSVEALATIEGVAKVLLHGARPPIIRIALDRPRLAAYGVSRDEIVAALRDNRMTAIGEFGKRPEDSDLIIWENADRMDIEMLGNTVLKVVAGSLVRLRDVARVGLDGYDFGIVARFNGKRVVLAEVQTQRDTQIGPATLAVYRRARDIAIQLPAGLRLLPGYSCEVCAKTAEKQ